METSANEFWQSASEAKNIALLERISRIRAKGIDIDGLLDLISSESANIKTFLKTRGNSRTRNQ